MTTTRAVTKTNSTGPKEPRPLTKRKERRGGGRKDPQPRRVGPGQKDRTERGEPGSRNPPRRSAERPFDRKHQWGPNTSHASRECDACGRSGGGQRVALKGANASSGERLSATRGGGASQMIPRASEGTPRGRGV